MHSKTRKRFAVAALAVALVGAVVGAAAPGRATAATTPSVKAVISGDVFCIAFGGLPCSGPNLDLERFGSQDNDGDRDGVASSSFTGNYSSALSAVNTPAGRLRASGSGFLPAVPAGGAGSIQVSSTARIEDTITLLSPARLTLRGFVGWSGVVATHVVVSRFERQGSGECCEVVFGELDAGPNAPDPRGAFSIPLDLPAGTFDFSAESVGLVDERAEAGQTASGSFDGALDFAIDIPAGTVVTSGSGHLPLVGGSPPPPQGNTPAGDNVQVGPLQGVTFTFSHVTSPGETSVTPLSSGPRPPLGYEVLGTYYELATTAAFDSAEVCFPYTGTAPSIVHFLEGALPVVLSTTRDTGTEVCAVVTSFSPFALVLPVGDTTAPTINCGAADGLWHGGNVSIQCTAGDTGSGLADPADASFVLKTNVPVGDETDNAATSSRQVCDVAGNCATAGPILGNKVDQKAPTLTMPADLTVDANKPFAADVTLVSATATDGGFGVQSINCPVGTTTLPLGTTMLACNAVDGMGNNSSGTYRVTVRDIDGPKLSLPSNLIVNATSPSGAAVTYAASASDIGAPPATLSCSPASGSTFAIGQTTVNCKATDAVGNSSSGSFTVKVLGAKEQLADLIQKVVNASQLSSAAKTLLIGKLNQLLAAFDPSNATQKQAVCLALQAFKAAVQLQAGKTITQTQAAEWIADANRIRAVLGC